MVAHFWWATWAIRSHGSFLVSDLSNALTSLIKKEGMSKLLVFILLQKTPQKYNFSQSFLSNEQMSQFPALIWAIWVNEQMSVERILSPEFSAGRSTADWAWGRALGMLRFPPLSLPWRTRPVWRWPARPVTSQYRCLSIVYTVQYNYFHNLCYCSLISNVNVLYVNFFFICEKYKIKLISVPSKASMYRMYTL